MAPSPAAGKGANPPATPTKAGKKAESTSTPKLDSAKDTAKDTAKSTTSTPRSKPPKLGASKATPKGKSDKSDSEADQKKIGLKDNDPSDDVEDAPGKVSQLGEETDDTKNTSVADTGDDLEEHDPEPIDDDEDETVSGARDTVDDAAKDDGEELEDHGDAAEEAEDEAEDKAGGASSTAKGLAGKASSTAKGAKDSASNATSKASKGDVSGAAKDTADDVSQSAKDTGKQAQDTGKDTAEGAQETAEDAKDSAEDAAEEATDKADETTKEVSGGDEAGEVVKGAKDKANGVKDTAEDGAEDVKGKAEDAAEEAPDAEEAVDGAKDKADEATDKAGEAADEVADKAPLDLSALKGLKVSESGEIFNDEGKAIGKLEEGDPADLEGYEIGDNGEILDEDGDVVGRAELLKDQAGEHAEEGVNGVKETAEDAKDEAEGAVETYLPELSVLDGLEVQENGEILNKEGKALGKITEGDPADLVGMTLNSEGEILDEDGDVVGRAETLPQEIEKEAEGKLPDLADLEGLEVGKDGAIKDKDGKTLGKITEGDPEDLVGRPLNEAGEVLDEDGDVIGRAEVVPQEAGEAVDGEMGEMQQKIDDIEEQLKPNLTIVEGKKLNKKGNILDEEGEVLAKLVEGDPKECAGKIPNENGEITDKDGKVIGKVEIVSGDAAEEAMKELHPELVEELEQAQKAAEEADDKAAEAGDAADEAKDAAEEAKDAAPGPDFTQLEGLKVNKKGEVVNEDGDPIARIAEGTNLDDVKGKKINEKGEIVDKDGNVLGKVEFIPEAIEEGLVQMEEAAPAELDTSILEGLKVNKKGEVLNEDGEPIARLSEGELEKVAGKKLNDKGEILDKEGNVIGKVEMITQEGEEEAGEEEQAEDPDAGLPPLSILDGLKVNKSGKIVDKEGNVVGELVEGDAKKLWKSGAACDEEGQFWDGKGRVIGRAKTLPQKDEEVDAEFAGLEGLVVVKDGWVEDENGNRVGRLTEGDAKKLVGRAVDEDGDVIDKRGNVVGHAERYEEPEPEQEEEQTVDLSELKGLTPNKQGNVIGPDGVPIGRLVEGNPKELSGRKIDENGQIWNDGGKVVGRVELIPENEREKKPEGPFAGLEGLVVVKDGLVEDDEHNVVGKLTEGDPKKLIGRAVDEDGDIIDKFGNVKGHAEPYEIPQEEAVEEDLSSLAGKKVNKAGKVVDPQGNIFGEVIEGDVKKLVGRKVDGQGNIWSDDGKVIGKAGLVQGGDDGKADGPFSGFDSTTVSKDGLVKDAGGDIVGRVIEGDPKKLAGRKVDDDGDILDKNGNTIGRAERWEPEEKEREVNPMNGLRVNREGEVRDKNGDVVGKLTDGNLLSCVGKEINENGYVVDQDGNKVGEVTLLENIPDEEEEEESPEELKKEEEREIAKKIANILGQTLDRIEPVTKQITELVEKADRTPKDELDEEKLVQDVKPLIEEGSRILGECNGAIRGLDPDGHIAAQAKARAQSGEASPEEHRVAEGLKELTTNVVKTIDNAKKRIADMPHAKKKLNPLWGLLTEPLFQIIAAVGLLLSGVLGLVGKLLNGLGLGGLVNGLLGGLGIDKLLGGLGLGSITESLGLGGSKKKK